MHSSFIFYGARLITPNNIWQQLLLYMRFFSVGPWQARKWRGIVWGPLTCVIRIRLPVGTFLPPVLPTSRGRSVLKTSFLFVDWCVCAAAATERRWVPPKLKGPCAVKPPRERRNLLLRCESPYFSLEQSGRCGSAYFCRGRFQGQPAVGIGFGGRGDRFLFGLFTSSLENCTFLLFEIPVLMRNAALREKLTLGKFMESRVW